ncbi:MAG TPA: hypothetical protein VE110_01400 [Gemmatimonadaceae bacterium]|nr:hypothetical protein [Gemmatimonadaceae bacterium]
MRRMKMAPALGVSALLIGLIASTSSAQARAPYIRIVSENGPGVASNYVMPAIDISEDAYVFAVAVDLDGRIQVLHPDFPGISVKLRQHQQYRLPNFFAGFSQSGGGVIAPERYINNSGYADFDTRGTVIALASRAPFNLERIEIDGDWDLTAIRRLIQNVSPFAAEQALASYLGAKGEPIGRDFMRFASLQQQFYSDALYNCDFFNGGYSTGLAFSRLAVLDGVRRFQRSGRSVRIVGYDLCGMPIVAYGPSRRSRNVEPPRTGREPRDTVKTKRFGREIPRHAPTGTEGTRAALGYFPITRHAEPPQMGDVTITARDQRKRDPREVLIDMRNQGGGIAVPQRNRIPVGRTDAPSRPSGAAATGTETTHEYTRPAPRETPPPPRMQPTQSPPRVEPPRSPPPSSSPPPRTQSAPSKPAESPPPRR